MKKTIAILGLIFSLFVTTTSYAAYPLIINTKDDLATATLTGAKGSTSSFQLIVLETPFPAGEYDLKIQSTDSLNRLILGKKTPDTNGSVSFSFSTVPSKKYYTRFIEINKGTNKHFYTTDEKILTTPGVTLVPGVFEFDYDNGAGSVLVKGKIDISKNPRWKSYVIKIQYSKNPIATADASYSVFKTHTTTNNEVGIADDGTYHLLLSNISPSVLYYIRQSITAGNQAPTTTNGGITNGTFKSDSGYTPSTPQTLQEDFENRSYRLLSPLPGFTLFLDPDLCAEQVAQGDKGQVCDINDVLNLGFKILIGAAAVLLVLRIMFEGYKYISSDIPALKVNAKAGIMDAALGLLLALSAFLILNTINPKLVQNSVSVDALSIGVVLNDGLGLMGDGKATSDTDVNWAKTKGRKTTLTLPSGNTVQVVACDASQMQSVTAFGKQFTIHKNLVASIRRIDTKWQAMPSRYEIKTIGGYNCRTIANSNKLSYHSYGLSVDINEGTNGVNTGGNMPASFRKLWTDEGWGWGGSWSSYKDPMHFSKGNNEGGDLKGE